ANFGLPDKETSQPAADSSSRIPLPLSPGSGDRSTGMGAPRRVYDVRPRPPAWGWQVVAYTWTKSIAAGGFLAILVGRLMSGSAAMTEISLDLALVAVVFLIATAGLLVADLKQPRRFLYVLLRPQWRSWLVRGAYLLTGYGAALSVWLLASLFGATAMADA